MIRILFNDIDSNQFIDYQKMKLFSPFLFLLATHILSAIAVSSIFKRDVLSVQSSVISRINSGSTDVFSSQFSNQYQFRGTPRQHGNKAEFEVLIVKSGTLAKIALYFDELDTETSTRDGELIENILSDSADIFVDSGVEHASLDDEYVKVFYIM